MNKRDRRGQKETGNLNKIPMPQPTTKPRLWAHIHPACPVSPADKNSEPSQVGHLQRGRSYCCATFCPPCQILKCTSKWFSVCS